MVYFVSSSLSALDQIQMTQNKGRRTIWLTLFFFVTALAIYQTVDVITSFLRFSMEDFESEEASTGIDVSVSVCFPMNTARLQGFQPTKEMLLKFKQLNVSCDVSMPSSLCQSLLTDRERFFIGNHIPGSWLSLFYTDYNIHRSERWGGRIIVNNLKFGNCITNDLKDMDTTLEYEHKHLEPIWVIFHQTGTPPIFHYKNVFSFDPGLQVQANIKFKVYVKKIVYEEKSWPFNSACVDSQAPIKSFTILNQDIDKPTGYNYSFEGCLDRCLFELAKSYCNCLLEKSMTGSNDQLLPICSRCNQIPQSKLEEMCNCRPSCRSIEISVDVDNLSKMNAVASLHKLINEEYLTFERRDLGFKIFLSSDDLNKKIREKVLHPYDRPTYLTKILMIKQALVTKKLSKRILINYEDAASTIGGVWGLWIGLSATVLISMGSVIIPQLNIDFATDDEPTRTTSLANIIHLAGVFAIASVFFWQMHLFIHDYYRYKVIQVKSIEDQDATSFPSIYICSNNLIFINEEILKRNVELEEKLRKLKRFQFNFRDYFLKYKYEFNEEEKMLLSPKIEDFIKRCKILTSTGKSLPCKANEIKFRVKHTPTVCATIDPMESINQSTSIVTEILLELKVPRSEIFKYSYRNLTVSLNPMSMVNVFRGIKFDQFQVSPGDHLNIKYSLTEVRKLPEPYASKCINESTRYTIWPKQIEEIGKSLNYSYNFQDCMDLCLEKMQHNQIDKEYVNMDDGWDEINFVLSFDALSTCQCKQPCRSKIYDIKTDQAYNSYKDRKGLDNVTDYENALNFLWEGRTVVRIQRTSSKMTVYSDQPETEPFSLVGAIGGISGIWVGQSLLNIYVELQLFCTVTFPKLTTYFRAIKKNYSTDENVVETSSMVYMVSFFLSALDHIRATQSKGRKTIWLILLSLATTLAIYHTAHVVSSCFGSNIMNDAMTKELNTEQYAVTFCVNILKDYQNSDADTVEKFERIKNINSSCDPANLSLFCLSLLSEEDRFHIGKSIIEYVYIADDGQAPLLFNNLYYGNCGTFKINWKAIKEGLFFLGVKHNIQSVLIMVVHGESASPVFTPQNVISLIATETNVKIVSNIVEYKDTRNWWFSGTYCENSPPTIGSWTIFNDTPRKYVYNYSQQACLEQCLHQLTKKYCQCILPKTMIARNVQHLPICSRCKNIPKGEMNSMCDCKPSCKNVEFRAVKMHLAPEIQEVSTKPKYRVKRSLQENPNKSHTKSHNGVNLSPQKTLVKTGSEKGSKIQDKSLTTPKNGFKNISSKLQDTIIVMVTTPRAEFHVLAQRAVGDDARTWPLEIPQNLPGETEYDFDFKLKNLSVDGFYEMPPNYPENDFGGILNKTPNDGVYELPLYLPGETENDFDFSPPKHLVSIDNQIILTKRQSKEPTKKLESLLSAVGGAWSLWLGFSLSVAFSITIAFFFTKLPNANPKLNLFLRNLTYNSTIFIMAAICIAQFYLIIEEYYQFKVKEEVSREFHNLTDFPTVYVCFPDNTMSTGTYGFSLLPTVEDYIGACEFNTHTGSQVPCRTKVIQFSTYNHVVNCAMVQPIDSIDKSLRLTDLILGLKIFILRGMHDATSLLVTFNPFATLHTSIIRMPVDQIHVSPGDSVDVQFSLTETRRLPEPYRSKCIDERSNNYTVWPEKVRDFVNQLEYIYTFEDCLFLCLYDNRDIEQCQCQLPCRDFEYKFDIIQKQDKNLQKNLRVLHRDWELYEFKRTTNASMRIRQPLQKRVIAEKPALDLINLSGQLGGLAMFWLGMPLLAFAIKFTNNFLHFSIY